ncbi:hypothetical protein ACMGDK_11700 [Chryseobacterium sp. DT-3]|uniref:hypothetical protein n=1 Tax=Chryseobacterium sp. DT-3 TaxID=3396164 RepID=UPI003F1BB3E3
MKTEQYLEIYEKTIPYTEKMISMLGKRKVLNKDGKVWADGFIEEIRFSENGELSIVNLEYDLHDLAFEVKINDEWYGHFPSGINTPKISKKFDVFFNNDAKNYLE